MKNKKSAIGLIISILLLTMILSGCGGKEEPEIVLGDTPTSETVSEEESVPETPSEEQPVSESVEESEPVEEPAVSEEPVESEEPVVSEESVEPEELPVSESDGGAQGYFTTTDLINGNEVTQQIFTNADITVVNAWGTFCGPCIKEMPYLGELAAEYDSSQVQFIGIPMDASDPANKDYAITLINDTGANYTHLYLNDELFDWGFTDIQYVPTTVFVNREGEIIDTVIGARSKEEWKQLIDSKLASQ